MSEQTQPTDITPSVQAPEATTQVQSFSPEYVQKLRDEAAKYRTEKNQAVEDARAEVVREYEAKAAARDLELSGSQTELSEKSLELLKLRAVLAADIEGKDALEVAALVQGSDEESVSASVQRVKALLGKAVVKDRPVDPSQGSGNPLPLNGDPLLNAITAVVNGKRRNTF